LKNTLSERAQRVFDFILHYKRENDGASPSLDEILAGAKISSKSMAKFYIDELVRFKKIRRKGTRNLFVYGGRWTFQIPETE
jgi:SOS-response transcriptional repressor LexA